MLVSFGIPRPKKKGGGLLLVIPKVTSCLPSREFPCKGMQKLSLNLLPLQMLERSNITSISCVIHIWAVTRSVASVLISKNQQALMKTVEENDQ
ncbi:hypothetical protein CFP56_018543, partial [Quercus suber]